MGLIARLIEKVRTERKVSAVAKEISLIPEDFFSGDTENNDTKERRNLTAESLNGDQNFNVLDYLSGYADLEEYLNPYYDMEDINMENIDMENKDMNNNAPRRRCTTADELRKVIEDKEKRLAELQSERKAELQKLNARLKERERYEAQREAAKKKKREDRCKFVIGGYYVKIFRETPLLLEKFLSEAAGDLSERDTETLKEVFELHDGDPSAAGEA